MPDWGCTLHDESLNEMLAGKRKVPYLCAQTPLNTGIYERSDLCEYCTARHTRNTSKLVAQEKANKEVTSESTNSKDRLWVKQGEH